MEKLTICEDNAREVLGISKNRVHELLEAGEIPAFKEGREWHVPVVCLEEYVVRRAKREAEERRNEKKVQMES